jgi:hypothetical protein
MGLTHFLIDFIFCFQYEKDGFLVIENFASEEEMESMQAECQALVDAMNPAEHQTVFSATKQVIINILQ